MTFNTQVSNVAVNAEATALSTLFNSGYLRIYDGTQPASADTAISTQVMLVELRFNATAFSAPTNGVLSANAITPGVAVADGIASWFRAFESDGTTVVIDGSAGTSATNLILGTTSISAGLTVNVTSFNHTISKSYSGI